MHQLVNWKDRIVERPRTYTEVTNSDGSRTDTPAPGEIQQAGTQMSATNFNQMDYGILDAHIAAAMMLIRQQQNEWRTDALETATAQEVGQVTLTNSRKFPFNNSVQTVNLTNRRDNLNYVVVIISAEGAGNIGEIEVTDRLVNGFKLAFTGSANSVTVKYAVIGGFD